MLARHAVALALLALALLGPACAGRAPEPAPVQPTAPAASQAALPTASPMVPLAEPTVPVIGEHPRLQAEIREVARNVLKRDVQQVQTAQQVDGRYTAAVAYTIATAVSPATPKASLAQMRDTAEEEAVALLKAVLSAKQDLAVVELFARATLENPAGVWQQDALRVRLSAETARQIRWEGAAPPAMLAGVDLWWWLDVFQDVGAASERQYAEKNAAFIRPRS